jgi:FAD/FMN-containing dehydrogenase
MTSVRVTTKSGADGVLEEPVVETLKKQLRGELLRPGDDAYDNARKVWNGMIDRRPALIARCVGVGDVAACVDFARDHDLLLAVRGGGHNVAGNAVCDGGLVVDLSPMRSVQVDPKTRTARAEPGVTWGDFDRESQAFGLATTGGYVSSTGIAGLTLGGGLGWLMGKFGLSCDNLLSVDVVTADGRVVTASDTENADLFWAVRGGGGNFGIVSAFEYRLHPVGQLFGGLLIHPFERAKEALRFFRDFAMSAPDELTSAAGLLTSPEGARAVAIVLVHSGSLEEGARLLQPIREFGPPIEDHIGAMSYEEVQTMLDATVPAGLRYYWKSSFLSGLSDDGIDILVECFGDVPSPQSQVLIERLGGAVSRVGRDETVFDHRDAPFNLLVMSAWSDAARDRVNLAWARETWEAMQLLSSGGVYVNYLGQEADEGIERIKAAYGPEKYERLVTIKSKYDPQNLFRMNQNIKPTRESR